MHVFVPWESTYAFVANCLSYVLQKELIELAASEATCAAQVTFCESLLDQVKRGDSTLLRPTVGEHGSHRQAKVTVPGACAACGLGFVASEVACVYTLACGDAYHALCFARWVGSEKECANPSYKQIIPELATSMRVHNEATNFCDVVAGSSDMPYVATLPSEVPNLKVDPTPDAHNIDTDMHSDDQSSPGGRESSSLASDKTLREEGSHVAIDKTPGAEVEPSQQTIGEPQPKEEPMEDVDVKMTDFVAQEGVEAMQRMVQGDADLDSPVFLSDMVKKSRKQKKHADAGQSKNTRASEMNRSKQQSIKAEEENDGGTSFTHGKAMSEEVPKSPPPTKKTPKKNSDNPDVQPLNLETAGFNLMKERDNSLGYGSKHLQEVLAQWRDATDRSAEAFTFNVKPTSENNYVEAALKRGGKTTSYGDYLKGPHLMPMVF
ncbi:hypothetical protein L7F22_032389 [Adiantum nelumboides]|nr:hypothetical protein [Adiantum nelumboides]